MSETCILIRLLRMYFPRNWDFGSALSKLRNFGGSVFEPPKTSLGRPLGWLPEFSKGCLHFTGCVRPSLSVCQYFCSNWHLWVSIRCYIFCTIFCFLFTTHQRLVLRLFLLAAFKFTPFLNLRLIIFGLTLIGWIISIHLSFYSFCYSRLHFSWTASRKHPAATS
jgi:hypothetical protein